MVMWHIKLKVRITRPGYAEKFDPRIKLVTFWWGQKPNTIRFLRERGDLRWRSIECVLVLFDF